MPGPQQAPPPGRPVSASIVNVGEGGSALFDVGNAQLATSAPHDVVIGKIPTPSGEMGVLTIRTATTTLTLTLTRDDVLDWIGNLTDLRDALSGAGLAVAAGTKSRLIIPGR